MTTMTSHRFALTCLAASLAFGTALAQAQGTGKLKVGLMLPATGTFAALGTAIENGFRLYVAEQGGKLVGPRDRVLQGRRRERPVQGHRQRQQADQARQRRCAGRHRAHRRGHGHGQGGQGHRHPADRAQCRRRRGDRPDVRAQHLPQQLLQLAAGLCDGRGGGQEGPQEGGHHHLEIRRRRRVGQGLQGGLREGRRHRWSRS